RQVGGNGGGVAGQLGQRVIWRLRRLTIGRRGPIHKPPPHEWSQQRPRGYPDPSGAVARPHRAGTPATGHAGGSLIVLRSSAFFRTIAAALAKETANGENAP